MDKSNILRLLISWKEEHDKAEQLTEILYQVFGDDSTSQFYKVVWGMFDRYTDALSLLFDDQNEWLTWFCWDNDLGKKKLKYRNNAGEKFKKMCSLKQLAAALEKKDAVL